MFQYFITYAYSITIYVVVNIIQEYTKRQLKRANYQRWHKYLVYKYKYEYIGLPLEMQMKLNKIHESWLS